MRCPVLSFVLWLRQAVLLEYLESCFELALITGDLGVLFSTMSTVSLTFVVLKDEVNMV